MSREKDLKDIKKISAITTKNICDDLNVDSKNLYHLKLSDSKTKMVKEVFIKRLKETIKEVEQEKSMEDILFEKYKDIAFGGIKPFKEAIQDYLDIVNANDIYARILNYQIKTYGQALTVIGTNMAKIKKISGAYER